MININKLSSVSNQLFKFLKGWTRNYFSFIILKQTTRAINSGCFKTENPNFDERIYIYCIYVTHFIIVEIFLQPQICKEIS